MVTPCHTPMLESAKSCMNHLDFLESSSEFWVSLSGWNLQLDLARVLSVCNTILAREIEDRRMKKMKEGKK
jgi:hypothetical protein